jgi:hypothetical protein
VPLATAHPSSVRRAAAALALLVAAGCAGPEAGALEADAGALDCSGVSAPIWGGAAILDGGPFDGGVAGSHPVVVISVDGLRADAVAAAPAETLIGLACSGAYSLAAQTILPSLTLPAHASMVSGYEPEQHGLLHDYYLADRWIEVPTVFSVAAEAGRRVAIVVGKQKLVQLAPPGTYDSFEWVTGGDAAVVDAAIAAAAGGFDVLFVHLPALDYAGHGSGWMSETYRAQLRTTDAEIARLVAALPIAATVIVTADHGGHGNGHGSAFFTDTTIPWIVAGAGVRAGLRLETPISVMDTAATAAWIEGLALPPDAPGCPVLEAFVE